MLGQGPYYGQTIWFACYHAKKIPVCNLSQRKRVFRVIDVLGRAIDEKVELVIVGGKYIYADLSFADWAEVGYSLLVNLGKTERF